MSDLFGRWTLLKNDNWDEYMKAIGVGIVLRKIACSLTTYEEIKQDETGEWIFDITSTFKNVHLRFKLGQEFDETTADGRHVKSTFELVDGVLRQKQRSTKEGGIDSIITRQVKEDGNMLCTLEAVGKNVMCYRTFARAEKS